MGNKPSAPPPPQPKPQVPAPSASATISAPTQAPPPPVTVCDAECQRQKRLDGLKAALDEKTKTKDTDPEGYAKARIDYYTELNGPDWLATEKERIAKDEVEPVLLSYRNQYNTLLESKKANLRMVNLVNMLNSEIENKDDLVEYLNKLAQETSDDASALNRLNELQAPPSKSSEGPFNMETILGIFIGLLAVILVLQLYFKFVRRSEATVMTAGKRVLNKLIR